MRVNQKGRIEGWIGNKSSSKTRKRKETTRTKWQSENYKESKIKANRNKKNRNIKNQNNKKPKSRAKEPADNKRMSLLSCSCTRLPPSWYRNVCSWHEQASRRRHKAKWRFRPLLRRPSSSPDISSFIIPSKVGHFIAIRHVCLCAYPLCF